MKAVGSAGRFLRILQHSCVSDADLPVFQHLEKLCGCSRAFVFISEPLFDMRRKNSGQQS